MLKKIFISIVAIAVSTLTFASQKVIYAPTPTPEFIPSVYLGLQGGYGRTNWDKLNNSHGYGEVSGSDAPASRFYLGYNFRKYMSLEAGYTQFYNDTTIGKYGTKTGGLDEPKLSLALDVLLKFKYNLTDNFEVYAKAGFDYLNTNLTDMTDKDKSNNQYNVAVGIGGAYNLNDNLAIDLTLLHFNTITKSKNAPDYLPYADFLGIGLTYKLDLM